MPQRLVELPWGSQPDDGSARINAGHWLTQHIAFAWDGRQGFVWHAPVAPAERSLPLGAGRFGDTVLPDGSGYVTFSVPGLSPDNLSLVAWAAAIAGTTDRALISAGNGSANDGQRGLFFTSAESWSMRRSSTVAQSGQSTGGWVSAVWAHLVGTSPVNTVSGCYVNGAGSTAAPGNARAQSAANIVSIAAWRVNGSYTGISDSTVLGIGPALVLTKVLDADEIARLYAEQQADPWSIWEPQRIWVPVSGGATWPVSYTETASPTDAATASYVAARSLTEAGSASDAAVAATTNVRTLSESASASEAVTAALTSVHSLTESGSASETLAAAYDTARVITEAASASDLQAITWAAVSALTEAASAADSLSTGAQYSGAVAEAASAGDAMTAAATLLAALAEAASAGDLATVAGEMAALLTESAVAADAVVGSQAGAYEVSITELAAAVDLVVAVLVEIGSIPSAPPIGHRLATGRRISTALAQRGANLSTRTR